MHQENSPVLDAIDATRRTTLKRLAAGAAFVTPVVLSIPLGSLAITDARAYVTGNDSEILPSPSPGVPQDSEALGGGNGGTIGTTRPPNRRPRRTKG